MASYKLTFNDRVINIPGWNGHVAFDYTPALPYIIMDFEEGITPDASILNTSARSHCTWTCIDVELNRWKLTINEWFTNDNQSQVGVGVPFLFCSDSGSNQGYLTGFTCYVVETGNFDTAINGIYCESMDRMFCNCTGLLSIGSIHCTTVKNVGGMYKGCTNVPGGQYDQYVWFSTYGVNITNHSGTFTDCGINESSGMDELGQIPVGWGGTLVPPSTLLVTSRRAYTSNRYTSWMVTDVVGGYWPDFDKFKDGTYIFTEASVGQYAGLSMNRSRIPNPLNGLGTTQGSYELYFYPAFVQCSQIPGKTGNTVSWIVTTDTPNGSLSINQGNTDMPGTLDYSTYGPFTREYGTYDSSKDVYFVFLVTNVPIAQWGGLNDAMGFLYSQYYNEDAKLRYF